MSKSEDTKQLILDTAKKEFMEKPKRERDRLLWLSPGKDRAKIRSKTFPGIAKAMAEQWGGMEDI